MKDKNGVKIETSQVVKITNKRKDCKIMFKQMCVQQGYVPPTCTMDGQICWFLASDVGDPCKRCDEDREVCKGRPKTSEEK